MASNQWGAAITAQLAQGLADMSCQLSAAAQQQLIAHCQYLLAWNRRHNLTTITEPAQMVTHHILDSLSIASLLQGQSILDVGTGGGFPGIPLAIAYPDRHFTLLDSSHKKCCILRDMSYRLALKNVEIVQQRVSSFRPERCFATIVARAWSTLQELVLQTRHLICQDGCWIGMKSAQVEQEVAGLDRPYVIHPLQIPGLAKQRCAVVIKG